MFTSEGVLHYKAGRLCRKCSTFRPIRTGRLLHLQALQPRVYAASLHPESSRDEPPASIHNLHFYLHLIAAGESASRTALTKNGRGNRFRFLQRIVP